MLDRRLVILGRKPRRGLQRGNDFADLGLPSPEEHQTKAGLVCRIAGIIEERHMTQAQAAEVFGIDQPKVSALLHGRFRGFSVYRLMCFIAALGHDVEVVTKKPHNNTTGGTRTYCCALTYTISAAYSRQ
jgi:predicted XRE-type DNA-binding protein